jgi:Domain of unknown function (DUF222)
MDSNTHSTGHTAGTAAGLAALAAELQDLAAQDPDRLPDAALAEGMVRLRRLANQLDGHGLAWLAAVDARGAAGADQGTPAPSTASWLRARLRLGAGAATSLVRTARALYRGPLTATGQALVDGEMSLAHAQVLAHGTHDLADHVAVEAEPVLLEAARRLDPARLRQAVAHLRRVADPEGADAQAERRHQQRRGLWVSSTFDGMVAVDLNLYPNKDALLFPEPVPGPDGEPAFALLHRPMWDLSWANPAEGDLPPPGLPDPRPASGRRSPRPRRCWPTPSA